MSEQKKRRARCGWQYENDFGGCACRASRPTPAIRARNAAIRCAVLIVLALVGSCILSGCASGGGSASNDPALAAQVRSAIQSTDYAAQVIDVTAQSDGKVGVALDSTGSDFKDQSMPPLIANAVLNKVPAVKQLTLSWSATGAKIGVYTAK